MAKILVIDDDRNILFAFKRTFEKISHQVISADDGVEGFKKIVEENPQLIFLDIAMPDSSGLEILERIKSKKIETPVIIMTGYGTMQTAIRAIQLGAYEYLTKPLDVDKLRIVADRALETLELKAQVKKLKQKLDSSIEEDELIGQSQAMQDVYKMIGSVTGTPNSTNVLILGESGTGKELVARAIHFNGSFSDEPFVPINCTVLPENLLESELFGHEKGAFTGAIEQKIGKFEIAGEGTIFLDEIGDLSFYLQQKFLRVLQERKFERVGGNEQIPVKARFIASTNKNLEKAVKDGKFREDLYFRLNVIKIKIPPLRERPDDIPLLAGHFLNLFSKKMNKNIKGFSKEFIDMLLTYSYPGNVRELKNIIERAVIMCHGSVLTPDLIQFAECESAKEIEKFEFKDKPIKQARKITVDRFEKDYIKEKLIESKGNVTKAAKFSGIHRESFQRLMKKHNIKASDFKS